MKILPTAAHTASSCGHLLAETCCPFSSHQQGTELLALFEDDIITSLCVICMFVRMNDVS